MNLHPSFESYQNRLKKFETFIESCTVIDGADSDYDKAMNRLHEGMDGFLYEVEYLEESLPFKTQEECELGIHLSQRRKYLIRRAKDKLIELGCDPDQM